MKANKYLNTESLERLAIISTPNSSQEFISISLDKDVIVLVLKDLSKSYYTNNFEEEVFYKGEDDEERIQTHKIKSNGDFIDENNLCFGRSLSQIHTFATWEKDNKSRVSDRVLQQFAVLSNTELVK